MTPRPRSEELVRRAAARAPRGGVVADVGTGSGAIAVAIAAARPDLTVWAIDTSSRAVLLARRNAALHGVAHRVAVREGDLLAPVTDRVDVVVANLPYLAEDERPFRPDLACEPAHAVFLAGDPLGLARRLLSEAPGWLEPDGVAILQLPEGVLEVGAAEARRAAAELSTPVRFEFAA